MSDPIKHDWYQSETHVVVEIRMKNLDKEHTEVEFKERKFTLKVKKEEVFKMDLDKRINPEDSTFKVMSTKVEVKMKKVVGERWERMERKEEREEEEKIQPVYPSSSGKDWNKIGTEIAKEADNYKEEGEAALNEMFQKIYAEGTDEVKKAMNKSFQESGGTVLSTNWQDIKKDKVEVKPPEGMEFKKWDS